MSRLKNSFIASIGLLALIGVIALLTPGTGQSQTDTVGPPKPVLVINSPSEPVPVTGTINVGSLGASPLSVRDVDNPARQPFRSTLVLDFQSGETSMLFDFLIVPAGKRLVIEHASVRGRFPDDDLVGARFSYSGSFGVVSHFLVIHAQGTGPSGEKVFAASEQVRAYVDQGETVRGELQRNSAGAQVFSAMSFTLSGYFVDLP